MKKLLSVFVLLLFVGVSIFGLTGCVNYDKQSFKYSEETILQCNGKIRGKKIDIGGDVPMEFYYGTDPDPVYGRDSLSDFDVIAIYIIDFKGVASNLWGDYLRIYNVAFDDYENPDYESKDITEFKFLKEVSAEELSGYSVSYKRKKRIFTSEKYRSFSHHETINIPAEYVTFDGPEGKNSRKLGSVGIALFGLRLDEDGRYAVDTIDFVRVETELHEDYIGLEEKLNVQNYL